MTIHVHVQVIINFTISCNQMTGKIKILPLHLQQHKHLNSTLELCHLFRAQKH